jgi:hypothetical protein
MASIVNAVMISTLLDKLCSDAESRYADKLKYFETTFKLYLEYGPFSIIIDDPKVVSMLKEMLETGFITKQQYDITVAPNQKLRVLGMRVFPFWKFSKTVIAHFQSKKDDYLKQVDESSLKPFDKGDLKKFLNSLSTPHVELAKGSANLSKQLIDNINEVLSTLKVTKLLGSATKGESPFGIAPNLDLGSALSKGNNLLVHIFTSDKCPGGGIFSLLFTFGGQEEMVHMNNIILLLVSLFIVGRVNFVHENNPYFDMKDHKSCDSDNFTLADIGKCSWLPGMTPLTHLVSFKCNKELNNWAAYHASLDQREVKPPMSTDDQRARNMLTYSSLLSLAKELGLKLGTGEAGCGIYGGDKQACIDAALEVLDSDSFLTAWMPEWFLEDKKTLKPDVAARTVPFSF